MAVRLAPPPPPAVRSRQPRRAPEDARVPDYAPHPRRRPARARDGAALLALVIGVVFGIAIFMPSEGRIMAPLHAAARLVAGRGAFLIPVFLCTGGVWLLVRGLRPDLPLPTARLLGATLIAVAGLPIVHLWGLGDVPSLARATAGEGGGLFGHYLGTELLRWLGGPLTAAVLGTALIVGALVLLNVTLTQVAHTTTVVAVAVAGTAHWSGRWTFRATRAVGRALRRSNVRGRLQALPIRHSRPSSHRHSAVRLANRPAPPSAPAAPSLHQPPPLRQPPAPLTPREWDEDDADPLLLPVQPRDRPGNAAASEQSVPTPDADDPADSAPPAADVPEPEAPTWQLPPEALFQSGLAAAAGAPDVQLRATVIEKTLASFGVEARVVEMNEGPAVTQFGIEPGPGVAVSRILSRQHDLALRLGVSPLRIEAPVPGKRMVGLEVPNSTIATVTMGDVLQSAEWQRGPSQGRLRLALGRDVAGTAIVGDLGRMPHLLIAGATGAGKSVCINTIVGSLLAQFTPDEMQLLMIDPKRVELVGYNDIPHLRLPVVTEMDKVVGALKWVVQEMQRRYTLFAQHGVRNLDGYNRWVEKQPHTTEVALPFLVVVIDELADMMMTAAEEVEKTLCRLAQLARATGIHLVVATQRPSVDVLTGLIKANFPTRIAFAVSSQTDSRVILDQAGAEKLLGRGDALYMPPEAMKPIRLQGSFVADDEIRALVEHWKAQGGPRYTSDDVAAVEALGRGEEEDDDVYDRAVELAETVGRLSVSLLQRRLGIGKSRAQRLLDQLVEEGIAES